MFLKLSSHLSKRIKKRMGIPKRGHKRLIHKFFERGKTIQQVRKEKKLNLFLYLCSIQKEGCELRYYNNYILVFNPDSYEGITVLNAPKLRNTYIGGLEEDETGKCKKVKRRVRQFSQTYSSLGPRKQNTKDRREWKRFVRRCSFSVNDQIG